MRQVGFSLHDSAVKFNEGTH